MTRARRSPITRRGLPGLDRVDLDVLSCHFYGNRDPLAAALVPYSFAGLRGDEPCPWTAAPPLPAREAGRALRDWDGDDVQPGTRRRVRWFRGRRA